MSLDPVHTGLPTNCYELMISISSLETMTLDELIWVSLAVDQHLQTVSMDHEAGSFVWARCSWKGLCFMTKATKFPWLMQQTVQKGISTIWAELANLHPQIMQHIHLSADLFHVREPLVAGQPCWTALVGTSQSHPPKRCASAPVPLTMIAH